MDGYYDGISSLKSLDEITSPSFDSFATDYKHIVEICKSARKIPRISPEKASQLLRKIRLSVSDFYSITAAHFIYGGEAALTHFCFLFNAVLDNIELSVIP